MSAVYQNICLVCQFFSQRILVLAWSPQYFHHECCNSYKCPPFFFVTLIILLSYIYFLIKLNKLLYRKRIRICFTFLITYHFLSNLQKIISCELLPPLTTLTGCLKWGLLG